MKSKKPSKLRDLRKAQDPPLTLQELARRAGVSYTTVWNLENGPEEKVHSKIKYKVARVLGVNAWELFPSEAVLERHYRFDCLFDFCPRLEFKNEKDVEKILMKMTLDELLDVYRIGSTPQGTINRLNRAAERLGLKAVELKK
jgi:transcriptional regulator with XRE-family HTH domain